MNTPKRPVLLVLTAITPLLPFRSVYAGESAGELFVQGYEAVELGLKNEREGALKAALQRYRVAVSRFERLKEKFPQWNSAMVDARIKKTTFMIAGLEAGMEKKAALR